MDTTAWALRDLLPWALGFWAVAVLLWLVIDAWHWKPTPKRPKVADKMRQWPALSASDRIMFRTTRRLQMGEDEMKAAIKRGYTVTVEMHPRTPVETKEGMHDANR